MIRLRFFNFFLGYHHRRAEQNFMQPLIIQNMIQQTDWLLDSLDELLVTLKLHLAQS